MADTLSFCGVISWYSPQVPDISFISVLCSCDAFSWNCIFYCTGRSIVLARKIMLLKQIIDVFQRILVPAVQTIKIFLKVTDPFDTIPVFPSNNRTMLNIYIYIERVKKLFSKSIVIGVSPWRVVCSLNELLLKVIGKPNGCQATTRVGQLRLDWNFTAPHNLYKPWNLFSHSKKVCKESKMFCLFWMFGNTKLRSLLLCLCISVWFYCTGHNDCLLIFFDVFFGCEVSLWTGEERCILSLIWRNEKIASVYN